MKKRTVAAILCLAVFFTATAVVFSACDYSELRKYYSTETFTKFDGELERNVTIRVLENDTAISQGYFDELLDGLFLGMLESRRSVMHLYNSRGWHHIIDYMRRRLSPLLEARARYIVEKEGMMVDEGDIQFVVQIHEIAAYGVRDPGIAAGMPGPPPEDLDRLHRLTRGSLEHALSNFDRRGEKRDTEA